MIFVDGLEDVSDVVVIVGWELITISDGVVFNGVYVSPTQYLRLMSQRLNPSHAAVRDSSEELVVDDFFPRCVGAGYR